MTQQLALSTNVVGFNAELHSDTTHQSFVHSASKSLVFQPALVETFNAVLGQRSGTFEPGSTLGQF